jgi:hypothetical protein
MVEINLSKGVSGLYHLLSGKNSRILSILSEIELMARMPFLTSHWRSGGPSLLE